MNTLTVARDHSISFAPALAMAFNTTPSPASDGSWNSADCFLLTLISAVAPSKPSRSVTTAAHGVSTAPR